jgi:hypothetical protein
MNQAYSLSPRRASSTLVILGKRPQRKGHGKMGWGGRYSGRDPAHFLSRRPISSSPAFLGKRPQRKGCCGMRLGGGPLL